MKTGISQPGSRQFMAVATALAALLLLFAGLGLDENSLILFLNPGIDPVKLIPATQGALILRVLLITDAVILFVIAWQRFGRDTGNEKPAPSLWMPNPYPAGMWGKTRNYALAMCLVLAAALLLRIISLNSDLWIDEVLTLVDFVRQPAGVILTDFSSDNQHLFFSLLSHLCISMLGENPWTLRLPSVLFGLASIWAAMQVASLVYGNRVAVYTGLLLALSYHHVWFSQNARGYMILLFGTLFSTWLLLRGLQQAQWRYWLAYALVIALSAWAHLTAVFVSLAHGLVIMLLLLSEKRLDQYRWMPVAGLLLAAWFTLHTYALVLPQLIEFFSRPGAGTGTTVTEWRSPLWLVNETFRNLGISTAFGWLGVIVLLGAGGVCCFWYMIRDRIFILLAILPALLLGTTMYALGRNLWPRMFFNEAGFVLMLLVVGLLAAAEFVRTRFFPRFRESVTGIPVLLLGVLFAVSLSAIYRHPKQDFTGARDFVRQNMLTDDRVVGIHMAGRIYSLYYQTDWPEADSLQELEQLQAQNGNTWVLYTLPRHIDSAMPELARALKSDYEVVRIFPGTLGDGDITVARSKL